MRSLLFLCLLGSAFGLFGMIPKDIMKKYSYHKIMSSCLGEEVVEAYKDILERTTKECAQRHGGAHSQDRARNDGTETSQTDEGKGQRYIAKIMRKVDITECVLQAMNYTNERNEINLPVILAETDELTLPSSLRDDFKQAARHCYDFVNCLPAEKAKHPLVRKMGRPEGFMKCLKMKEIMACMRQDFIKYGPKKGLDGNDVGLFELIMTFGEGKEDQELF